MTSSVIIYNYPAVLPLAADSSLHCQDRSIPIFDLETTRFAHFALNGSCELELKSQNAIKVAVVRPQRLKVPTEIHGHTLKLQVAQAANLCVEVEGQKPLMLYIDDANAPESKHPGEVIHFDAGRVHEIGELHIRSGQRVHIEPGAIVRGTIRAANAADIAITGRGILDGAYTFAAKPPRKKLILLEACRNVLVEGITMIRPASWMLALADCTHAQVRYLRQIGEVVSSDGIDVVGSRQVHIHHCFLKNNDDCVAIKAVAGGDYGFLACDPAKDVSDVLVEQCAFWNDRAGNVMEIGFETRCPSIRDITFRDIDVMAAHGYGGVFTIHNGDRADISNVLYDDIRVEHMFDRMIDFQVMYSRYSKDAQRGRIHDIAFRHIRTHKDTFNTINLLGGYDAAHPIEDIHFHDFRMGDQPILSADHLALFTRHAHDIHFEES